MEWTAALELTLQYVQVLIWPALIVFGVLLFRKEVRGLIDNLESAKSSVFEATFFKRSLADPNVSEDRKDLLAEVWRDLSLIRHEEVPQAAQEQLKAAEGRSRGKVVDDSIIEQVSDNSYREKVREAFDRVKPSDGDIGSRLLYAGSGLSMHSAACDFTISAAHGLTTVGVFVQPRWDTVADELVAKLNEILVVAPDAPENLGRKAVRWTSPTDDEAIADVLEANKIFDYLPNSSQPSR